jgi:S1-C subfamily serine protease
MLVVDIVAVAALLVALVTGVVRGLFASLGTILGIVAGALLALWLVPLLTPAVSGIVPVGPWRSAALAVLAIGTVLAVTAIGAAIGAALRRGVDRTPLKRIERLAGGVVTVVVTALALLTVGAGVTAAGIPVVSSAVGSSQVLRTLDRLTPPALDDALAQARGIVTTDTLPRLGSVIGVVVSPTGPPIALDDPALQQAAASVARISGTAYSCGVSMTGSGFVAGNGLVVTNAHVIAGVDTPIVELPGGPAREGRLVYLDPIDDLAVISVSGLAAPALDVVDPAVAGTRAAVQGYPLGGPFRNRPANIVSVVTVPISDIYEESAQPRSVYALDADVRPGNSGGPLLDERGDVIGVVFARGVEGEHRGYAMTSDELRPVLESVSASDPAVDSGRCTS